MTKQDTRKLPRIAVDAIRIKVMQAVVNEGISQNRRPALRSPGQSSEYMA